MEGQRLHGVHRGHVQGVVEGLLLLRRRRLLLLLLLLLLLCTLSTQGHKEVRLIHAVHH